jgi:acetyl-CoA C-acetyltransferase
LTAPQFGALVVQETIKRSGIQPEDIDQTIFANAWQAGFGPNPARITAVKGGVPKDTLWLSDGQGRNAGSDAQLGLASACIGGGACGRKTQLR